MLPRPVAVPLRRESMDDRSATIPRYGLAPPTEDDALAMLARALGADRAASVWIGARAAAGLRGGGALSPEQLLAVAERLAERGEDGVTRVVASSLAVRARTYLLLQRHQAGAAPARKG